MESGSDVLALLHIVVALVRSCYWRALFVMFRQRTHRNFQTPPGIVGLTMIIHPFIFDVFTSADTGFFFVVFHFLAADRTQHASFPPEKQRTLPLPSLYREYIDASKSR